MTSAVVRGKVITGKKRGRDIGYPTANVQIPEDKREFYHNGTYAGKVEIGNQIYIAAIFIPQQSDIVEAYILDYTGDLYGQAISITISERLRDNIKFEGIEQLREQISKDVLIVRQLASSHKV